MHTTTNPADLAPLTELANGELQGYLRTLPDFATSSRWNASAVVLRKDEGPEGYQLQIGFELNTPLVESMQETMTDLAATKEAAARQIVGQWIEGYLKPALAMHSEAAGEPGQTPVAALNRTYFWRMGAGPLVVACDDKAIAARLQGELMESPLFRRLDLAAILPIQQEIPMLCLKLQVTRPPVFIDPAQRVTYECKLNNRDWPQGLEVVKRFQLPAGSAALRVTQCLFFRRGKHSHLPATGSPSPTSTHAPVSKQSGLRSDATRGQSRPWWKVW